MYMSIAMLYDYDTLFHLIPYHDQLDDLESFYYVLHELMFSSAGVGKIVEQPPSHLDRWDGRPHGDCAISKNSMFFDEHPPLNRLSSFWLPATVNLLDSFYQLAWELVKAKRDVTHVEEDVEPYKALLSRADEYYDRVLALFDRALEALDDEEADVDPRRADEVQVGPSPSSLPPASPTHTPKSIDAKDQHRFDEETINGTVTTTKVAPAPPVLADRQSNLFQFSAPRVPEATPARLRTPLQHISPVCLASADTLPVSFPTAPSTACPVTPKRSRPAELTEPPRVSKRPRLTDNATTAVPPPPRKRTPWVRTSPHRTRAWMKANVRTLPGA